MVAYRAGLSVATAAFVVDSALALLSGDAGLQEATRSDLASAADKDSTAVKRCLQSSFYSKASASTLPG